jgi:small subunit ribosomal protein S35
VVELARPFEPPTPATPFRFRYTSFLGESHPSTNKVVVEFTASDMDLLATQRDKLIKLAGARYNPDNDVIKMSCEDFDTQAQNKRFLGETISKLLEEAKNGADTFEDVPFDFRHHKPKKRFEFPQDWILTPERKQYLEQKRAQTLKLDDQKLNNGLLVDGKKVIETSLPFTTPEAQPVMVGGARGKQLR